MLLKASLANNKALLSASLANNVMSMWLGQEQKEVPPSAQTTFTMIKSIAMMIIVGVSFHCPIIKANLAFLELPCKIKKKKDRVNWDLTEMLSQKMIVWLCFEVQD